MKHALLLLSILLCINISFSQTKKKEKETHSRITSIAYLENLLKASNNNQYVITSEYTDSKSGIKHTYLRQAIDGIEVYGTESSIHRNVNGNTLVAQVNFVDGINNSARNMSRSMSAEQVIASVSQQMGYQLNGLRQIENLSGSNQKGIFNKAGISRRDIPVKLMYFYGEDVGFKMVWELSIRELDSPDWWNFWADATTGNIIDKNNWTVSCKASGDHSDHGHEMMARNKLILSSKEKKALPLSKPVKNLRRAGAYTVFGLPMESPYLGGRTVEANPENATASPLGWHDDGLSTFTYTRGNNVSAYDDGSDDDEGLESDHTPESASGSVYDYAFDATDAGSGDPIYTAADQSEDAAITNLFYWNNIIHDILYQYGFDEASGNFQEDNFANGGAGGDSVDAQAQDSADLAPTAFNRCNANFGTPPDGDYPIMQMYICDGDGFGSFNDGDYDNIVVIHEYAHGISNRLVGGPADANALNNAEQMGEGWSDYYGYMLTMDAVNATSDREVGNFLFELGDGGGGIRNAPYSTSFAINDYTYVDVADGGGVSQPHGIGFIWATMLYDMTQALIADYGFDPDLYNGTGGNNMSLELVTLGLKLTSVFPGFVDGRDAILAADMALYGGANQCLIWEAFANRGLGFSASQGSSDDRFDGIEAFDMPGALLSLDRPEICISEGVAAGLGGGLVEGGMYSDVGGFVTDGGDGMTFSFDAASAGVGDHMVTYTEPCNGLDAMATITVTNGIPNVSCSNVTLTLDGSGMAIYDPVASIPDTLVVVGGNNGSSATGSTTMQVSITQSGSISFDWLFESGDSPGFDDFGYTLNGAFTNLSNAATYPANGNSVVALNIGDVIEFTVNTDDNGFGGATSTITNFSPGFEGQFAEINWTEVLTNSDGSTNFSGNINSTIITGDCGNPVVVSASQTIFTCNDIGDNIVTISADNGIGIGTCEVTVTIEDNIVPMCTIIISPKVVLQGPILNPTIPGLMNDILREDGFLPATSPYADLLPVDPSVFNLGGLSGTGLAADDIVDWIWVELRDSGDNTNIIAGQSALLQRDGNIVDLDGTSVLTISAVPADYYVAFKHRNHTGAMSQATFGLTASSTTIVDFTNNAFSTFGTDAQVILGSGDKALWAGNVNGDTTIQYVGAGVLDTSNLLGFILNDGSNFLNLPTWSVTGYNDNDVDMNGVTQYAGAGVLDTPNILQNILSYPGNFLNLSTWQIVEQLPEN